MRDSRYVGAKRCATCHPEAYEVWRVSRHARALDALDERSRRDPRCRQCHTTAPDEDRPELAGVQCEACHGPGRDYALSYVMRDEELRRALGFVRGDTRSCTRCHDETAPSLVPFDAAERLERIRHWGDRSLSAETASE